MPSSALALERRETWINFNVANQEHQVFFLQKFPQTGCWSKLQGGLTSTNVSARPDSTAATGQRTQKCNLRRIHGCRLTHLATQKLSCRKVIKHNSNPTNRDEEKVLNVEENKGGFFWIQTKRFSFCRTDFCGKKMPSIFWTRLTLRVTQDKIRQDRRHFGILISSLA